MHATIAGVAFGLLAPARPRRRPRSPREWAAGPVRRADRRRDAPDDGHRQRDGVGGRAPPAPAPPADELRDRADLRPRQRRRARRAATPWRHPGRRRWRSASPSGSSSARPSASPAPPALAVRLGARPAARRADAGGTSLGVGAVAGIGFTVSLFIAGLAFDDADLQDAARLAVLVTSVVAAVGSALAACRGRPGARRDTGLTGSVRVDAAACIGDARAMAPPRVPARWAHGCARPPPPPRRGARCPTSSPP